MDKKLLTALIVVGAIVVGYVLFRWYQANKAGGSGGQLGTNLNSVAPELVGGSSGPTAQPQFDMPVNITLTETITQPQMPDSAMLGVNAATGNPMTRQNDAATMQGASSIDDNTDYGDGTMGGNGSTTNVDTSVTSPPNPATAVTQSAKEKSKEPKRHHKDKD